MIPETEYTRLNSKSKLHGKTRNLPVITRQLQTEATSAVRFTLSDLPESTPGISASSPLTVASAKNGNAWVFYWEKDQLMKLFSFVDGQVDTNVSPMSDQVLSRLRSYHQTLTRPFVRGEGLPNKCTRVYRLPLATTGTHRAHEVRVLAYHFPKVSKDYLRVNFLTPQTDSNDWDILPIAEILKVHSHPTLVTEIAVP